eukprot:CAMPEP_0171101434 /NCGR_PEP_ID=MMETSP0766_2-20121228/55012_1 /TAXON_ID=439317 /ORGANISM="Gambierdiscus australes, Strain CAWD 149" /LENGTH=71 /DNA_ID=CAMNT_0011561483 /DNA_START=22 /DNA_END=233 /DNA_ORIENTATION=+
MSSTGRVFNPQLRAFVHNVQASIVNGTPSMRCSCNPEASSLVSPAQSMHTLAREGAHAVTVYEDDGNEQPA